MILSLLLRSLSLCFLRLVARALSWELVSSMAQGKKDDLLVVVVDEAQDPPVRKEYNIWSEISGCIFVVVCFSAAFLFLLCLELSVGSVLKGRLYIYLYYTKTRLERETVYCIVSSRIMFIYNKSWILFFCSNKSWIQVILFLLQTLHAFWSIMDTVFYCL